MRSITQQQRADARRAMASVMRQRGRHNWARHHDDMASRQERGTAARPPAVPA